MFGSGIAYTASNIVPLSFHIPDLNEPYLSPGVIENILIRTIAYCVNEAGVSIYDISNLNIDRLFCLV